MNTFLKALSILVLALALAFGMVSSCPDFVVSNEYEDEAIFVMSATDINERKVYLRPLTVEAILFQGVNTGLLSVVIDTPDGSSIPIRNVPWHFMDSAEVNALVQNSETNQPESIKGKGRKLNAALVWDFDWGTFIPREKNNYVAMGQHQLFQDKEFCKHLKERWYSYKGKLVEILAYVDEICATLHASDAINNATWPVNRTINQDKSQRYAEAVVRLKTAYQGKYNWLDTNI